MFLLGDAVSLAKKGQHTPPGYYNLERMLSRSIENGGDIYACGTCLEARGLNQEELVNGLKKSTMADLVMLVKKSSKTLTF